MLSIIALPEEFLPALLSNINEIFVDLSPLVFIIIGLAVGLWVLESIVNIMRK